MLCPFESDEIVVTGLARLWAAGHNLKLVLAGPERTHARDRARPVDNILMYQPFTIAYVLVAKRVEAPKRADPKLLDAEVSRHH